MVDDHPVNLKVAAAMLNRLGYPNTCVPGGVQALDALAQAQAEGRPFHIVLLDNHMPGMDGLATARAIHARWGQGAPDIISMSASSLAADQERALAAGMRVHLPKPLELERLDQALRSGQAPQADTPDHAQPEGRPADATALPALDHHRWDMLAEFDDAEGSLRREIAHDFLESLPRRLTELHAAADCGDLLGLQHAAHLLRGAANNLGALALGGLLSLIHI